MERLRVGVVGLGLGRLHVQAYAAAPEVARLVICDLDEPRLSEMRGAHPQIAEAYSSLERMLAQEQLDAVSIVTPDHLHRPHAEACFDAGCHVLLTKPIATNLADGRAIVRAAEAAGKQLMVAHERRYHAPSLRVKELIDGGALGEVVHLRLDAIADKRGQFQRSPWYASAAAGRTALVGTGIHEVDLARFLVGRPIASVCAQSNQLGTLAFPGPKTTTALFRFQGDAIAQVTVTYEAHGRRGRPEGTDFHLVGTQGLIIGDHVSLDGAADWEILPSDRDGITVGSHACVRGFIDALVRGAPVPISGRDAFASLSAAAAADRSAAIGQFVTPEEL